MHGQNYLESMQLKVKGNLKRNIEIWKSIGSPEPIVSMIEEGHEIPFHQAPPSVHLSSNRSAFQHADFVEQTIFELLQSNRVVEVFGLPHVVNP